MLGFEGYNDILKLYLQKYRESVKATGEKVDDNEKEEKSDEEDEEDDENDDERE